MSIDPTTLNTVSSGSTQRSVSRELDKEAFMQILVAQLSNQDPLNPSEDKDFIAQMAQFSTLEQMQSLNEGFTFSQACSLVGKNIYPTYTDESGAIQNVFGVVTSVMSAEGQPYLEVDGTYIPYTADVVVYDYGDPQEPQVGDMPVTDPVADTEPVAEADTDPLAV